MSRAGIVGRGAFFGAHLVLFAVAGYAFAQVLGGRGAMSFVIWFVGAAILHDVLFLPAYCGLDVVARRAPRAVNHLRFPAVISGALLLVWFPLILVRSGAAFTRVSGLPVEHYARNWAMVTVALFACSAVLYGGRELAGRRRSSP
jgi:hypothetical protein